MLPCNVMDVRVIRCALVSRQLHNVSCVNAMVGVVLEAKRDRRTRVNSRWCRGSVHPPRTVPLSSSGDRSGRSSDISADTTGTRLAGPSATCDVELFRRMSRYNPHRGLDTLRTMRNYTD